MSSLGCAERVEVFREADGQRVLATRVSGATLQSLPSVAGRGALFGVLYDDGQSELVCIPVLRVVLGRRARDRPPPQTPFWGTPQPAQFGGGSWRFSGERCPLSSHKHTRS